MLCKRSEHFLFQSASAPLCKSLLVIGTSSAFGLHPSYSLLVNFVLLRIYRYFFSLTWGFKAKWGNRCSPRGLHVLLWIALCWAVPIQDCQAGLAGNSFFQEQLWHQFGTSIQRKKNSPTFWLISWLCPSEEAFASESRGDWLRNKSLTKGSRWDMNLGVEA